MNKFTEFESGFLACALWSSTTLDGENFDDFSVHDFEQESLERLLAYANKFYKDNEELISIFKEVNKVDDSQVGHSLWLSSNGHGAGFFDFHGKEADKLQELAGVYNNSYGFDLYSDEGKVCVA